jgi:hypothetical protein
MMPNAASAQSPMVHATGLRPMLIAARYARHESAVNHLGTVPRVSQGV